MPTSVELIPVTADRFEGWKSRRLARSEEALVRSGVPRDVARQRSARQLAAGLPDGLLPEEERIWDVEADGDHVGSVWARLNDFSSGREVFVRDLTIDKAFREGIGEAAIQACESTFKAEGADWVRLMVAPGSVERFENLGYSKTFTTIKKPLAGTPRPDLGPVPEIRLEPMTQEQFDAYIAEFEHEQARNTAQAGILPEPEAQKAAEDDVARRLPDGLQTPGHLFFTAYDGDEVVGTGWFQFEEQADGIHVFGNEIKVREDLRGRGYGRALVSACGDYFRERNVVTVGGRVLGDNERAKDLFGQYGLTDTNVQMKKTL